MTALEKWKNDFKEFISELSMPRDDYKGIMQYINEVPNEALDQQPCDDCISRQAVLDGLASIAKVKARSDAQKSLMGRVMFFVEQLPPVTPKEKIGHWVKTPKAVMGEGYIWYCDKCEHQVYQDTSRPYPSEKYCPDCGCHMIEPQESEERNETD